MTADELKQAVAAKVADEYGVWINRYLPLKRICEKVSEITGKRRAKGQNDSAFLHAYLLPPVRRASKGFGFRPLVVQRHWRQDEIDAAQPPFKTIQGVGNGMEPNPVWRR